MQISLTSTADHFRLEIHTEVGNLSSIVDRIKLKLSREILARPLLFEGYAPADMDRYSFHLFKARVKIVILDWLDEWPVIHRALSALGDQAIVIIETTDPIDRLIVEIRPRGRRSLFAIIDLLMRHLGEEGRVLRRGP